MKPPDSNASLSAVRAIARAADVLRALATAPEGLTLGQLAAKLALPRSAVHRIAQALRAEAFVARDGHSGLRVGPELARLASASQDAVVDHRSIPEAAHGAALGHR